MKKLRQMAIAYKLALNFDYCPTDLKEAQDFYGKDVSIELIRNYGGNRTDEIARMLAEEVLEATSGEGS